MGIQLLDVVAEQARLAGAAELHGRCDVGVGGAGREVEEEGFVRLAGLVEELERPWA